MAVASVSAIFLAIVCSAFAAHKWLTVSVSRERLTPVLRVIYWFLFGVMALALALPGFFVGGTVGGGFAASLLETNSPLLILPGVVIGIFVVTFALLLLSGGSLVLLIFVTTRVVPKRVG